MRATSINNAQPPFAEINTWSEALSLSSTATDSKSSLYLPVSLPTTKYTKRVEILSSYTVLPDHFRGQLGKTFTTCNLQM